MRFLNQIWLKLKEIRGTASALTSTLYTNLVTNKQPPTTDQTGGRIVAIKIHHVCVTADTVDGTVLLQVHPKGWSFVGLHVSTDGLSASAGVGQLPVIGDGTTANKYMLASDFDASGGVGLINGASLGYTPTADKPITLTFGSTGDPVAGKIITGYLFFIPGS